MAVSALAPLEIATHTVFGTGVGAGARAAAPRRLRGLAAPLVALEDAIRPSLRRGRCFVSFSGGHDSSLILAVGMRVARAEGLPPPIPLTLRFTGAPRANETAIQDAVIGALAVPDWERITIGDELDLVGPVAHTVLRRHGLMYPFNTFLQVPLLARARGGTLLTGLGGDQLFVGAARPRRPWPFAPWRGMGFDWLQPAVRRRFLRTLARERRRLPRHAAARSRWQLGRRYLELSYHSYALLADDHGAAIEHPLTYSALLDAVESSGTTSYSTGGRAALLSRLFGFELPAVCTAARPKALFGEVFWNRHAAQHLERWNGDGVDTTVVDPDRLRSHWARGDRSIFTALLAQQTWLSTTDAAGVATTRGVRP